MKQSVIMTEDDFRAAVSKQCGFPLQLKDREPTGAEVLSALQFALTDDQLSVMEQSYDQFQIDGGDQ